MVAEQGKYSQGWEVAVERVREEEEVCWLRLGIGFGKCRFDICSFIDNIEEPAEKEDIGEAIKKG